MNESTTPSSSPDSLSGLLEHFLGVTEGQEKVKIGELLDSLDSRSHGPMLLFPAIIAASPLGMIPGMSIVTGSLIILIATQMMFFSSRPWIPSRLANFEFSREKLRRGVHQTNRWVKWGEKLIHTRFQFLASGLAIYPIALVSILLAVSFYPLALVPFAVFVPASAVVLFGLGLTARDGLLIALGFCFTVVSLVLIWTHWPF